MSEEIKTTNNTASHSPEAEAVSRIIAELEIIRDKYVRGEEVGNDDWVKPAAILRESMEMFGNYNNKQK